MSLQTNIFEDGRWVTRNIDPYQARAQNAGPHQKEKVTTQSLELTKAPIFGLITRTLVRSSVINWIIPARVRHSSKNDVLFITAGSITIKKAAGNYTLEDVAVKADFDSPIRSAKIIGEPRKLTRTDKYAFVLREDRTRWPDQPRPLESDDERCQDNSRNLPPHIVVLALESDKLVFLCTLSGPSNHVKFRSYQRALPASHSPSGKLGAHMAVDPKSRALAVAGHEGNVYVYALKSITELRQEYAETSEFNPITEEKLLPEVPIGGSILKMEFLHPPQNDHGQIILLLILSKNGKTRMHWYEWNAGMTLHQSEMKPTSRTLPQDEQVPLLLIPLKAFAAFMLVCEKRITVYKDILTGTPHGYIQHLTDGRKPEEPGSSGRPPLWVQWARPMRTLTDTWTINDDAIYLCREDGIVQYLTLKYIDHMLDSTHQAGRLGVNATSAFAILDVGHNTEDMLVAGGEMSDGGIWHSGARIDPEFIASIPNWTPLNDFATVSVSANPPKSARDLAVVDREQERMFACTGRGRHGAITELRYGYEASQKYEALPLGGAVDDGVVGIWAFHGFFGDAQQQNEGKEREKDITYVLISCPLHTLLIRIGLKNEGEAVTEDWWDLGLEYNAKTITAGATVRGFIQITEDSIRVTHLPAALEQDIKEEDRGDIKPDVQGLTDSKIQAAYCFHFQESRVVAARIYDTREKTFILLAMQRAEDFYLQLSHLDTVYIPVNTVVLHSQPSYLLVDSIGDRVLAFVSNVKQELFIFGIDNAGSHIEMVGRWELTGSFAICDSMAIITSCDQESETPTYFIVCGLRNGSLQTLRLDPHPSYALSLYEELDIGHTSVTVISDATRRSRAIVHCEKSLSAMEYTTALNARALMRKILITDRKQPDLQLSSLSAVTQAVDSWMPESVPGYAAGSLFCIDGNALYSVSITHDSWAKMVPRRLPVGGTPVRVIHSTQLKKLIVLYTIQRLPRSDGYRNLPGKRALLARIAFLNPDHGSNPRPDPDAMDASQDVKLDENDTLMDSERKPGERFIGITEWFPHIGGNEYHMLVLNTKLTRTGRPMGRLLFFAVSHGSRSPPKLALKKKLELDGPVRSVAAYPDGRSIVYCSGNDLCVQSLDCGPSGFKWRTPVKAEMRSPARHITVREPLIYVSSTRESLAVFRFEIDKLVYQYGDQSARDGLHHLVENSLVLSSDMSNTVVGLWQPPERRIDNAMNTVFEAVLPVSITRLRHLAFPNWSRKKDGGNEKSIIGSSADGTITQLDVVEEKYWRLLRFIQNMAERNPLICPFAGRQAYRRHIEPSTVNPRFLHVNGDILERVLDRGAADCLRDMLNVEPDLESHTDFDCVEDRWSRFKELSGGEGLVNLSDDNDVFLENVVQWIQFRLRSVL